MSETTKFIRSLLNRRDPSVLLLGFGLILIFLVSNPVFSSGLDAFSRQFVIVIALGSALGGIGIILLAYLQSSRTESSASDQRGTREQIARLQRQMELVKSRTTAEAFSEPERANIIAQVTGAITNDTVEILAAKWAQEFQDRAADRSYQGTFLSVSQELVERLQAEVTALGKRANVNLVIGILVSALGLVVLTWFVVAATAELSAGLNTADAAVRFAVRLSLAIFIQVFAYFFLRLYRYSLFEIKYFQNEITGAQFRLLGLLTAIQSKDNKVIEKTALEMLKTERNFILKKGETTLALQKDQLERENDNRLIAMLERMAGVGSKKEN